MNEWKGPLGAVAATALCLASALVGRASAGPDAAGAASAATSIEAGGDHLTSRQFADLLLARPSDVVVVDVRPAEEFAAFALPGAHNLDLPRLLGAEGAALLDASAGKTVVLVSEGMVHPAQAWIELARRGRRDVRVLEDGLAGFLRDELMPASLRASDAAPADPARGAALRRYVYGANVGGGVQDGATTRPAAASRPAGAGRHATDPARLTEPTIVSTAWAAARGDAIVFVDARDKAEDFVAGRLPAAVHAPVSFVRGERDGVPDELLPPDALAKKFGALGIDAETEVVVYAAEKLQDATHAALALLSLGHAKVAVLEGGLAAWKAEGRPLASGPAAAAPKPKFYAPRAAPDFAPIRVDELKDAVAKGTMLVVDSRPPDQFRGEVPGDVRPGHIPGSKNRPVAADVAKSESGVWWRPKEELAAGYAALGVKDDVPVVATCRSGHQASETYFTLRFVLGRKNVRWYDGSWKEWSAKPELPTETGAEKP